MGLAELFILAVGLSMDAFAVSICKGLCMRKVTVKKAGIVGLYFGAFQAGMPLLGYALGVQFQDRITALDHWIAFVLLGLIGTNMIREALSKGEEDCVCPTDEKEELGAKNMRFWRWPPASMRWLSESPSHFLRCRSFRRYPLSELLPSAFPPQGLRLAMCSACAINQRRSWPEA